MKKLLLAFLCVSGWITTTSAQSKISGSVTDSNGPLAFVNVVLHSLPDSTTVSVESTDLDGNYTFTKVEDGEYYLESLMLSYQDILTESFALVSEEVNVDISMIEETNMLSTVEITGKVPLMEQRADKLVVNVARSLTSVTGSLLDVMKKVPGMIVVNGKLRMPGNANPTIYINGRS